MKTSEESIQEKKDYIQESIDSIVSEQKKYLLLLTAFLCFTVIFSSLTYGEAELLLFFKMVGPFSPYVIAICYKFFALREINVEKDGIDKTIDKVKLYKKNTLIMSNGIILFIALLTILLCAFKEVGLYTIIVTGISVFLLVIYRKRNVDYDHDMFFVERNLVELKDGNGEKK